LELVGHSTPRGAFQASPRWRFNRAAKKLPGEFRIAPEYLLVNHPRNIVKNKTRGGPRLGQAGERHGAKGPQGRPGLFRGREGPGPGAREIPPFSAIAAMASAISAKNLKRSQKILAPYGLKARAMARALQKALQPGQEPWKERPLSAHGGLDRMDEAAVSIQRASRIGANPDLKARAWAIGGAWPRAPPRGRLGQVRLLELLNPEAQKGRGPPELARIQPDPPAPLAAAAAAKARE
jgi:hypothetical protein